MPVSGNANNDGGPSSTTETIVNYRQKYRNLKRKFRYLIYENECFQDELQKAQRKLLKVNQDKSFLLDRLLQYEKLDDSSSDSDATISSDSELDNLSLKRKKTTSTSVSTLNVAATTSQASSMSRPHVSEVPPKRKKAPSKATKSKVSSSCSALEQATTAVQSSQGDGHMTSEEIERHLESRQILMDLLPERAPPTVPTEMFSNDPSSMESEQNEAGAETSPPSNLGDAFGEDDSLIIDLPDQQSCI